MGSLSQIGQPYAGGGSMLKLLVLVVALVWPAWGVELARAPAPPPPGAPAPGPDDGGLMPPVSVLGPHGAEPFLRSRDDCKCQCSGETYIDENGEKNGFCGENLYNEKRWCYVSGEGAHHCPDVEVAASNGMAWSHHACSTPARTDPECKCKNTPPGFSGCGGN